MIDPSNITDFDRSEEELQEFALFCPAVAGKMAKVQAQKLEKFLSNLENRYGEKPPFDLVGNAWEENRLETELRNVKLGKYSMLVPCYRAMSQSTGKELLESSAETLKKFPGVGDKTARFFLMHANKNAEVATLDTHVLSWMDENLDVNVHPNAPRSTSEYERLEYYFLRECQRRGRHPASFDLEIWNQKSK